jgi:hypothetical protein
MHIISIISNSGTVLECTSRGFTNSPGFKKGIKHFLFQKRINTLLKAGETRF